MEVSKIYRREISLLSEFQELMLCFSKDEICLPSSSYGKLNCYVKQYLALVCFQK